MGLVKMAPGSWRYYAKEIATGVEDYYAEGSVRGFWIGRGARDLELSGSLDAVALERLFGHGADPLSGLPLGRSFSPDDLRAVAGFGLTFAPPKTVSVLWATGGSVASEIERAQDVAIAAAMVFLDQHAAFTRRGPGGVFQVDSAGLIAAAFKHRTSRAGDPQLHTHVLVANKVRALEDGAWLSLDARELYRHQKAAGMLYKAAVRAELTASLGVQWTPVDQNGIAEIAGVPTQLADAWSTRRHQVTEEGDRLIAERAAEIERSLSAAERAECFQLAAYRTRAPKTTGHEPTDALMERWNAEATTWGYPPEQWLDRVVLSPAEVARGNAIARTAERDAEREPHHYAEVTDAIASLEESQATFLRADVVEVLSTVVTGTSANRVRERIEQLADEVIANREVVTLRAPKENDVEPLPVRRSDAREVTLQHGATRFTTRATLAAEARVLDAANSGIGSGSGVVRERVLDEVLRSRPTDHTLGVDQDAAVRALCREGDRIALLVGPAGAGKSFALSATREAWEKEGLIVGGVAPSAMAASVLADEAGIRSETIAKFLLEQAKGGDRGSISAPSQAPSRFPDVLVVDEASMARTTDLAALVRLTGANGSKLVLVGDPHQLGAVGAGGIFATLVRDHQPAELETVRRFENHWERAASLRLRAGDPSVLSSYDTQGRIEEGSRSEMITTALQAWQSARRDGLSIVIMTGENATADEVSQRCRAERVRSGEVESDGVAIRSGVAGDGDEIVTLRNDRRIRTDTGEFVRNGARWTVIGRTANGELHVQGFDGASTVLPATYVREDVGLAYALTVHKAQGQTTDRAVLFVDDRTTAEQLYVGMTRGRLENRAFVVTDGTVGDEHSPQPTTTAKETLVAAMRRSANEPSAHDVMRLAFEEARQRPRRQEEIDYAEMPHVEHVIRGPHLRM